MIKMAYMGRIPLSVMVSVAAAVFMSVPCSGAGLRYAEGQEDSLSVLVVQYEEDVRAAMVRAIRTGMLDARTADSVADAARQIVKDELPLQVRAERLKEMRLEWADRLNTFYDGFLLDEVRSGSSPLPSAMLPSRLPVPDSDAGNGWGATRLPSVAEILARDRRLILTRMINETPEFVRVLQHNPSIYVQMLYLLLGLFNFGTVGTWEMLVPSVEVGGKPEFDDMIFLDPNFDPRVYQVSVPVPQYDPLNPTELYKASVRTSGTSGTTSGPPPVQQSRYVVP